MFIVHDLTSLDIECSCPEQALLIIITVSIDLEIKEDREKLNTF